MKLDDYGLRLELYCGDTDALDIGMHKPILPKVAVPSVRKSFKYNKYDGTYYSGFYNSEYIFTIWPCEIEAGFVSDACTLIELVPQLKLVNAANPTFNTTITEETTFYDVIKFYNSTIKQQRVVIDHAVKCAEEYRDLIRDAKLSFETNDEDFVFDTSDDFSPDFLKDLTTTCSSIFQSGKKKYVQSAACYFNGENLFIAEWCRRGNSFEVSASACEYAYGGCSTTTVTKDTPMRALIEEFFLQSELHIVSINEAIEDLKLNYITLEKLEAATQNAIEKYKRE